MHYPIGHLLESRELTRQIFDSINGHLAEKGLMMREGGIVDATPIAAPPSTNATRSRANLRVLLGRSAGVPPRAIRFAYGRHGKPRLAPGFPAIHFNLSHSADVVLYVLAPDGPELGIDVELQRPLADLDRMAARVLTGRGRAEYQALDGAAQQHAFYQAWTGKEALAKASGEGLSRAFEHFELTVAPLAAPRIHAMGGDAVEAARWRLLSLAPRPGYLGALAVRAPAVTARLFQLAPDQLGKDGMLCAPPIAQTFYASCDDQPF